MKVSMQSEIETPAEDLKKQVSTRKGSIIKSSTKIDSLAASHVEDADADKLQEPGEQLDKLIDGLALILNKWSESPSSAIKTESRFYSARPPRISIKDYLSRMRQFFICSDACFVLGLVYITRVVNKNSKVSVCAHSAHRLSFVAMMLAAKVHEDVAYSNGYYAKVGGLPAKEVNLLEIEFLKSLDWRTSVTPNEYNHYQRFVCEAASRGVVAQLAPHEEPEPEHEVNAAPREEPEQEPHPSQTATI
jgi:hypothetical protein